MTKRLITPDPGDFGEELLAFSIRDSLSWAADEAVSMARRESIDLDVMKVTILHRLELDFEGWADR